MTKRSRILLPCLLLCCASALAQVDPNGGGGSDLTTYLASTAIGTQGLTAGNESCQCGYAWSTSAGEIISGKAWVRAFVGDVTGQYAIFDDDQTDGSPGTLLAESGCRTFSPESYFEQITLTYDNEASPGGALWSCICSDSATAGPYIASYADIYTEPPQARSTGFQVADACNLSDQTTAWGYSTGYAFRFEFTVDLD